MTTFLSLKRKQMFVEKLWLSSINRAPPQNPSTIIDRFDYLKKMHVAKRWVPKTYLRHYLRLKGDFLPAQEGQLIWERKSHWW